MKYVLTILFLLFFAWNEVMQAQQWAYFSGSQIRPND